MRNVDRLMRLVASVELEPDRYKRMEMIAEVRMLEKELRNVHPGEREEAA